jgi:hypothetical protein
MVSPCSSHPPLVSYEEELESDQIRLASESLYRGDPAPRFAHSLRLKAGCDGSAGRAGTVMMIPRVIAVPAVVPVAVPHLLRAMDRRRGSVHANRRRIGGSCHKAERDHTELFRASHAILLRECLLKGVTAKATTCG